MDEIKVFLDVVAWFFMFVAGVAGVNAETDEGGERNWRLFALLLLVLPIVRLAL